MSKIKIFREYQPARKMETRTTLRFYLIPVRMAKTERNTKTNNNGKLPINKGQETLI